MTQYPDPPMDNMPEWQKTIRQVFSQPLPSSTAPIGQPMDAPRGLDGYNDWERNAIADYNVANRSEFTRGMLGAVDQTQGMLYGALGAAGSMAEDAGIPGGGAVRDFGFRNYQQQQLEAAQNPRTVQSYKDIDSVGDAGTYVAGTAGSLVPFMAETAAMALIGAATGAATGTAVAPGAGTAVGGVGGAIAGAAGKKVAREMIEGLIKKKVAQQVAKGIAADTAKKVATREAMKEVTMHAASQVAKNGMSYGIKGVDDFWVRQGLREMGKRAGARAGVVGSVAALEGGGMYGEGMEEGYDNPYSAMGLGLVSGSVELLGGNSRLVTSALGGGAGRQFKRLLGQGKVKAASEMFLNAVKQGGEEALQEAGQESLSMANAWVNDPDFKWITDQHTEQWINAGLAGAIGGTMGSAVTSATSRPQEPGEYQPFQRGELPVSDFTKQRAIDAVNLMTQTQLQGQAAGIRRDASGRRQQRTREQQASADIEAEINALTGGQSQVTPPDVDPETQPTAYTLENTPNAYQAAPLDIVKAHAERGVKPAMDALALRVNEVLADTQKKVDAARDQQIAAYQAEAQRRQQFDELDKGIYNHLQVTGMLDNPAFTAANQKRFTKIQEAIAADDLDTARQELAQVAIDASRRIDKEGLPPNQQSLEQIQGMSADDLRALSRRLGIKPSGGRAKLANRVAAALGIRDIAAAEESRWSQFAAQQQQPVVQPPPVAEPEAAPLQPAQIGVDAAAQAESPSGAGLGAGAATTPQGPLQVTAPGEGITPLVNETPASLPSETVKEEKPKAQPKIGDSVRVANRDATLADRQVLQGMAYEIYNGPKGSGIVRVVDADVDRMVDIRVSAKFDDAARDYAKAIRAEGGTVPSWIENPEAKATEEKPAAKEVAPKKRPNIAKMSVQELKDEIRRRGFNIPAGAQTRSPLARRLKDILDEKPIPEHEVGDRVWFFVKKGSTKAHRGLVLGFTGTEYQIGEQVRRVDGLKEHFIPPRQVVAMPATLARRKREQDVAAIPAGQRKEVKRLAAEFDKAMQGDETYGSAVGAASSGSANPNVKGGRKEAQQAAGALRSIRDEFAKAHGITEDIQRPVVRAKYVNEAKAWIASKGNRELTKEEQADNDRQLAGSRAELEAMDAESEELYGQDFQDGDLTVIDGKWYVASVDDETSMVTLAPEGDGKTRQIDPAEAVGVKAGAIIRDRLIVHPGRHDDRFDPAPDASFNPDDPAFSLKSNTADSLTAESTPATGQTVESLQRGMGLDTLPPDLAIVSTYSSLPEGARDYAEGLYGKDSASRIQGLYHNGQAYIVADRIPDAKTGVQVMLHELLGHKGFRQTFGMEFGQVLDDIARSVGKRRLAKIATVYKLDLNTQEGLRAAADEYIAQVAEMDQKPSWWRKVVYAVKKWLRDHGFKVRLSDGDINAILAGVRKRREAGRLDMETDGEGAAMMGEADAMLDAEYLAAVEAGDMEKAQAMVDAAAKRAGYEYHRYSRKATGQNDVPWLMFTEDRERVSSGYGRHHFVATDANAISSDSVAAPVIAAISEAGMGEITTTDVSPPDIVSSAGVWDNPDMTQEIWDKVLERMDVHAIKTPDGLVVFSPSQIKSADPVTYDDAGNVIPLSKRFDAKQADIRFKLTNPPAQPPSTKPSPMAEAQGVKMTEAEYEANADRTTPWADRSRDTASRAGRGAIDVWNKYAAPVSDRIRAISERLYGEMKAMYNGMNQTNIEMLRKIEGFAKAAKKMTKRDLRMLKDAMHQSDGHMIRKLADKYGIRKEHDIARAAIDSYVAEYKKVGIDIGEPIPDYWPRRVKDVEGLISFLKAKKPNEWSWIQRAIDQRMEAIPRKLEKDELAHLVNTMIRGFNAGDGRIGAGAPSNLKARKVDVIPIEAIDRFYMDPFVAAHRYVTESNKAIAWRKFLGKATTEVDYLRQSLTRYRDSVATIEKEIKDKGDTLDETAVRTLERRKQAYLGKIIAINTTLEKMEAEQGISPFDNLENSIGMFTLNMLSEGKLNQEQETDFKRVLLALYKDQGPGKIAGSIRDISYMDAMGQISSTITQIQDLALGAFRSGLGNAVAAFWDSVMDNTARKLTGEGPKSTVTRDMVLLDMADEFRSDSVISKALDTTFKVTGLHLLDRIGKETIMNASLRQVNKQIAAAKAGDKQAEAAIKKRLQEVFGESWELAMEQLEEGDTQAVISYAFNELSEFQPVSQLEMPEGYLMGGNARLLYALKSYQIKQLSVYRNQLFRKATKAFREKDKDAMIQVTKDFMRMAFWLVLMGATANFLKDWLYGREIEPDQILADSAIGLTGISRFDLYNARRQGMATAIYQRLLPPHRGIDALYRAFIGADDTMTIQVPVKEGGPNRAWTVLPVVGRLYYEHAREKAGKKGDVASNYGDGPSYGSAQGFGSF